MLNPPDRWDRLWTLRCQIAGAGRSVARAGADGALEPIWSSRIVDALDDALRLCDLARVAGAVLPVRPEPPGAAVEVHGAPSPTPLPTELEHAADWSGLR